MSAPEYLQRTLDRRLSSISTTFKRYLYQDIDWRDNLIGIKGPKGTGKSTLMLQHIKEAFPDTSEVLYASLDDFWFTTNSFTDIVEDYYAYGGRYLFLDEIHYLDSWQTILKNLNDNYPGLFIAYTGSSMLKMEKGKGDLSRRLIEYNLTGLSFREYLAHRQSQWKCRNWTWVHRFQRRWVHVREPCWHSGERGAVSREWRSLEHSSSSAKIPAYNKARTSRLSRWSPERVPVAPSSCPSGGARG